MPESDAVLVQMEMSADALGVLRCAVTDKREHLEMLNEAAREKGEAASADLREKARYRAYDVAHLRALEQQLAEVGDA